MEPKVWINFSAAFNWSSELWDGYESFNCNAAFSKRQPRPIKCPSSVEIYILRSLNLRTCWLVADWSQTKARHNGWTNGKNVTERTALNFAQQGLDKEFALFFFDPRKDINNPVAQKVYMCLEFICILQQMRKLLSSNQKKWRLWELTLTRSRLLHTSSPMVGSLPFSSWIKPLSSAWTKIRRPNCSSKAVIDSEPILKR